jgi:hypothetical protein
MLADLGAWFSTDESCLDSLVARRSVCPHCGETTGWGVARRSTRERDRRNDLPSDPHAAHGLVRGDVARDDPEARRKCARPAEGIRSRQPPDRVVDTSPPANGDDRVWPLTAHRRGEAGKALVVIGNATASSLRAFLLDRVAPGSDVLKSYRLAFGTTSCTSRRGVIHRLLGRVPLRSRDAPRPGRGRTHR